jgi:nitroreductase
MQLKKLAENRYSVRAYLSDSVEQEKINYILDCARLAPSACNYQPWKFYVITDKKVMEHIQESYNREWLKSAPVYIIVCKDASLSWKRKNTDNKDFGDVDAAIAAEHICLAATEMGLGTCWICNFDPDILKKALHLSSTMEALALFPLGYIDKEKSSYTNKNRKPLSDIIEWI